MAEQVVVQVPPFTHSVLQALAVRVPQDELDEVVLVGLDVVVGPFDVWLGVDKDGSGVGILSGPILIGGSPGGKYIPGAGPTPKTSMTPVPPPQKMRHGKKRRIGIKLLFESRVV
jgi:hypothetical protein